MKDELKHIRLLALLDENNILVMTAQVLMCLLNHNFMRIDQINLLVVDECHNVVKESPTRRVMEQVYRASSKGKPVPRILGLTAALFRKQCKLRDVDSVVRNLEIAMNARVVTASDKGSVLQYVLSFVVSLIFTYWYCAIGLVTDRIGLQWIDPLHLGNRIGSRIGWDYQDITVLIIV